MNLQSEWLQSLQTAINKQIDTLHFPAQPNQLYDPIKYFLTLGGKRMRPMLSILTCHACGGSIEKALLPSLGLEFFHNFTLIHDDIMDAAPLRRGKTTIHEKWNTNVAILAGDVTLIKAYELFRTLPPDPFYKVVARFNQTAIEVCEGQQLDMDFENRTHVHIPEYIHMITLKTAVLLGFSMYLGALLAGINDQDAEKLYRVGTLMGISFQIKDDYLDVYGDSAKVGKFSGGDIVAGKKTYLLITALESASNSIREQISNCIRSKDLDKTEKVRTIISIYDQLNVKEITSQAFQSYFQQAIETLQQTTISDSGKSFICEYFDSLLHRES